MNSDTRKAYLVGAGIANLAAAAYLLKDGGFLGFRLGTRGGMTCDVCRGLVWQTPADAEAHRQWHRSLGDTSIR